MKIWLRVLLAAVGVTILALVSSPGGDTESGDDDKVIGSTTVADCVRGEGVISGSDDWRADSIEAGPVGIHEHPLRSMSRQPDGSLVTNMPILIEGHDKVTVAIASGQRERASLYYGGDAGDPQTDPGYERIRFHPCAEKDRTTWPGYIRVEGGKAVRLKIIVADEPAFIVSLGRPKAGEPPEAD